MFTSLHADLSLNDPQELPWLFSKCAKVTPDNTAVIHGREAITYKELDTLTNRYADYLHKKHGIGPGDFVCVAYERGINFIIAILSALKCGAAYVPIDVKEPLERRVGIIEEAAPKIILAPSEDTDTPGSVPCVNLEDVEDIYTYSPDPRTPHIHSQDIACVFFTSGSTGRPKGVLLPHLALTGLIRSPRYLSISSSDRVLSSSSIAFDAASFEIWTALINSATLVCVDYETIINPESFAEFLDHQDISVMWVTSALFDQLVTFRPGMFRKVKYLMSGGDVVNPKTVYKVLNNSKGRPGAFINGYGPTETGILATFEMITELHSDNEPLPIGKALADTVLYLLDENRKPVAPGEAGELYIGGHRLAKGYLNLPEKTAKAFIKNPFTGNPTDILYRTGDLARFRDDGSLLFAGRADRQIKFRGFRLELDGVENILTGHEKIANAAIKMVKVNADKLLVAYIQPEAEHFEGFCVESYKSWLKDKMPSYSIPTVIMVLEKLPVTQRGKIDRKSLPDPVIEEEEREDITAPRNETEQILYEVWSACLGRTRFGVTDNFFELGGSSILLATVYTKIRERISKPFTLNSFLINPTIEGLAETLNSGEAESSGDDEFAMAVKDSVLDTGITPAWGRKAKGNAVLLTGSTGFLGAHILDELLKQSDRPVYCIIRPGKEKSLHDLQFDALERYALDQTAEGRDRIRPVAGDLSENGLGLSSLDYQRIRDNCSHIIHCGAYVHHIFPYSRLKKANCSSTLELIRLAFRGNPKKLSFISTESAVTECDEAGVGYEQMVGDTPPPFFGGYALSKWVSERLMNQAMDRGMDGLILRPGNIFANSETGISSPVTSNFALLMMRSYIEKGLAPDMGLVFEAVPVNLLAKAVVASSLGDCSGRMLNLSNPEDISLETYIEILSEISGREIKLVDFHRWKEGVIDNLREDDPLYPLALYFQDDPEREIIHFDTSQAQEELAKNKITYPGDYRVILGDAFDRTLRGVLNLA